ncbi:MAG: rhodanese-like domain-containing protein [Magnetococcales bacterium]|nr:rhodanese-like domain-containing protein [Magnetococcales bacterium]
MGRQGLFVVGALCGFLYSGVVWAEAKITQEIASITVPHGTKQVTVTREQDPSAVIDPVFARVSRPCPPYCAQPMVVLPRVQTIGEVELIDFMRTHLKAGTGVLVDARTPDWHAKGTIPGSINVPYTDVNPSLGADEMVIEKALERFGVRNGDFSKAKSLVLWCNGSWCGQSPTAIRGLVELGYPREKLFYYRGGMQAWKIYGLTVVPPAEGE